MHVAVQAQKEVHGWCGYGVLLASSCRVSFRRIPPKTSCFIELGPKVVEVSLETKGSGVPWNNWGYMHYTQTRHVTLIMTSRHVVRRTSILTTVMIGYIKSSICNGWIDLFELQSEFPSKFSQFSGQMLTKTISFSVVFPFDPLPKRWTPRPRTWVWWRMGLSRPWGQRRPRRLSFGHPTSMVTSGCHFTAGLWDPYMCFPKDTVVFSCVVKLFLVYTYIIYNIHCYIYNAHPIFFHIPKAFRGCNTQEIRKERNKMGQWSFATVVESCPGSFEANVHHAQGRGRPPWRSGATIGRMFFGDLMVERVLDLYIDIITIWTSEHRCSVPSWNQTWLAGKSSVCRGYAHL